MRAIVAGVVAGVLVQLAPAPAAGADRITACVSREEFRASAQLLLDGEAPAVRQLARSWGVLGYGVNIAAGGRPVWSYPLCGYDHATRQGEVLALTGRGGRVWALSIGRVTGSPAQPSLEPLPPGEDFCTYEGERVPCHP